MIDVSGTDSSAQRAPARDGVIVYQPDASCRTRRGGLIHNIMITTRLKKMKETDTSIFPRLGLIGYLPI